MFYIFLIAVLFCLLMSLKGLLMPEPGGGRRISLEHLYWIITVYFIFLIGFGLLYLLVDLQFGSVILLNGASVQGGFFAKLAASFYFSTMTLLSVGYGDVVPIGIGRWIASVEAMIGYALPAAFVVRAAIDLENISMNRN